VKLAILLRFRTQNPTNGRFRRDLIFLPSEND
jgi:hypothetical protein